MARPRVDAADGDMHVRAGRVGARGADRVVAVVEANAVERAGDGRQHVLLRRGLGPLGQRSTRCVYGFFSLRPRALMPAIAFSAGASPRAIGAEQKRFQREAFGRDTLAGLGGLLNGIRDGVLFRRELGVGQCPSDGVRVVHTEIVLRRPRCRTADRVTCPPGRTKLGPAWCSLDTELTLRRSRRRRPDSFNGSTRPVARRHSRRSRRGIRRHRGLKRTSRESGRYPDQDRDTGLLR